MLTVPIILLVIGILTGVVLKILSEKIKVPYTVALFAVGVVAGLVYKLWPGSLDLVEDGLGMISNMNPDFILYVFLPVLVFDAAYEMDLHVFRRTLTNASILAGPGLVICMLLTACLLMLMEICFAEYRTEDWVYALMFGGLLSATDPVAVVALLQELKTSKRFSTLVDGESLLNDGTGIVCFMLFYSRFNGMAPIQYPLLYFAWVVTASLAIGYVFFQITRFLLFKFGPQEMIQNCIVVAIAYLVFYLAQSVFDVSGVIALVVYGHLFALRARPYLKPEVNEFMEKFWNFLAYLANTLIFLIVGVVIASRVHVTLTLVLECVVLFIGLNLVRYVMIGILYPILKRCSYGLTWQESIVLGWGGLRGALGMSMALMVSYNTNIPENIRHHILFMTAGIVTLTLCINGTTSKWLVNKLKLIHPASPLEKRIQEMTQNTLREHDEQTLENLQKNPYLKDANWEYVKANCIQPIPPENLGYQPTLEEALIYLRMSVLNSMKIHNENYYANGSTVYRNYRIIQDAIAAMEDYEGTLTLSRLGKGRFVERKAFWRHTDIQKVEYTNLLRSSLLIASSCKRAIEHTDAEGHLSERFSKEAILTIYKELDEFMARYQKKLKTAAHEAPEIFKAGVTDKATRILLASERHRLNAMVKEGYIGEEVAEEILEDIDARQGYQIVE